MALRGETQDFGFADALQLIVQGSKSGALRCMTPGETVVFGLDRAHVTRVETEGRPTGARLGNRLVRSGLIDRDDLGRILVRRARTQEPLESLVVEFGLVPIEKVQHHVTLLSTDSLLETFLWPTGTYEFIEGGAPEPSPWIVPISLEQLLVQGVPLVHDWPQIDESIPSARTRIADRYDLPTMDLKPALTPDLLFNGDATSTGETVGDNERVVHGLCEPGLDVQTVLDRSPFHRMETCRCLRSLLEQQFLSFQDR